MGTESHTRTHRGVTYAVSPAHPAAGAFPWLPEAELQALADDIAANGQQYKIVRLPDGRVVDGRNRELACLVAGEEPQYAEQDMGDDDVVRLVLSRNVHRRHLDASQRAMVAAQLATLAKGRPPENASRDAFTQAEAAGTLDVSRSSVQRATAVVNKAPELVEPVRDGRLDVKTAAKVAAMPPETRERVATAADPKEAARDVLADAEESEEEEAEQDGEAPPPQDETPPQPSHDASRPVRPAWMVPGGKAVDPDHPFCDVLKKFTALSAALTRVLRGEHGRHLVDALVEVGTHPHRVPLVAFTSDVIDGLEVRRGTVRFVGLYALRCLVNDVGNWKRDRKPGQALAAFKRHATEAEQVVGEGEE